MKVLYVEDNSINRLVLQKSLQKLCNINAVADGTTALDLAKENQFDVYVLDLNLGHPRIDGFFVLHQLKSKYKHKSLFVALTAYSGEEWQKKCIDSGFDMYFNKPIKPQDMWHDILVYNKPCDINFFDNAG